MPAFHGAGIRVRLGSLPLADSVTPKCVLKKGEVAARQCEQAEKVLRDSKFLDEERVQFPGDEENFGLNWLGEAPFFQVLARGDALEPQKYKNGTRVGGPEGSVRPDGISTNQDDTSARRTSGGPLTRAHAQALPSATLLPTTAKTDRPHNSGHAPKALVLHVILTEKTFYENLTTGYPQHLKIDVFFNGQLSNCVLVHQGDIRAGAKSMHQIFGGVRVDYLIERPWVILPTEHITADGLGHTAKIDTPQERWHKICATLMKEANDRGVDANSERPPSAVYLTNLASMQMPNDVQNMQKPGGRTFGIVDVVVTVGLGKKITSGVAYLKAPMRLVDERYSYEVSEAGEEKTFSSRGSLQEDQNRYERCYEEIRGRPTHVAPQEPQSIDHDADGDSDPKFGSAPPPAFHDPFTGAQSLAIPRGHTTTYSVLPTPTSSQNVSSVPSFHSDSVMKPRKRAFSEFAASASASDPVLSVDEHVRSHNKRQSLPLAHVPTRSSTSSLPAQTGDAEFHLNQYDGFLHANPYQLPYQGMMAGLDQLGIQRLSYLDRTASSPIQPAYADQHTLQSINSSDEVLTQDTHRMGPLSRSSPFLSSSLPSDNSLRMSYEESPVMAYDFSASIHEQPSTLGSVGLGMLRHSTTVPNRSSELHPQYESHVLPPSFQGGLLTHPLIRLPPPPGPPPPLGLFPATKKPRTILPKNYGLTSLTLIDPGLIDPSQPRSSILVRRLVIKSKGGKIIVDHEWQTPQRVAMERKSENYNRSQDKSNALCRRRQVSLDSAKYTEASTAPRRSSRTLKTIATPPLTSPAKMTDPAATLSARKTKRDSVFPAPNQEINTVEHPSADNPQSLYDNPTVAGIRRRGILSIQGPKANRFVMDDPEELLRKAKANTKSRSISSLNANVLLDNIPAGSMGDVNIPKGATMAESDLAQSNSTSPLSSLPSSPEQPRLEKHNAEEVLDKTDSKQEVTILSLPPAAIPDAVPSTQDPPEPSTKPASPPRPLPQQQPLSLPTSNKKKITSLTRLSGARVRMARSRDRLDATNNPPLNRDCVIQYAVSEQNVTALRQVKGERQGVFTEESVVVGMRFFVAG